MKPKMKRLILGALGVGAVAFAVQGGEFGTSDLLRQRGRKGRLIAKIDTLRREVDSLTKLKRSILTDPYVQERIAREEFGMVRGNKEILYRFAEPQAQRSNP